MKARIKKTGEIVEVYKNKHGVYIDKQHRGFDAESLEFLFDEDKHWQDVRERAAIAAMQGTISMLSNSDSRNPDEIADFAVACADALIEELKKKKDENKNSRQMV